MQRGCRSTALTKMKATLNDVNKTAIELCYPLVLSMRAADFGVNTDA